MGNIEDCKLRIANCELKGRKKRRLAEKLTARRDERDARARRRVVCMSNPAAVADGEVRLSVKLAAGEFSVDRSGNGALRNVSILTMGPAIGHDFVVDEVMLRQVAAAINEDPRGKKCRLSHPWMEDAVFYRLGWAMPRAAVDGNKVRTDIEFGKYARSSPKGGDLAAYLMDLADDAPDSIGVSITFQAAEYQERTDAAGLPLAPAGRIKKLLAVDIVDDPAANPDGLLSKPEKQEQGDGTPATKRNGDQTMKGKKLSKKQKSYLKQIGLADGASDEQLQAFVDEMDAEQREIFESLATQPPAKPAEEEPEKETSPTKKSPGTDELAAAQEEALAADKKRRAAILALAEVEDSKVSMEVARQWADDGVSLADAKRLAEMAEKLTPVPTGRVDGGQDRNLSTIAEGVSDALLLRAGWGTRQFPLMTFDKVTGLAERDQDGRIVARKPHARAESMRRMPMAQMARCYLAAVGVPAERLGGMAVEDVISLASGCRREFARKLREAGGSVELAMSTSDFPYILADALGKVFLGGYNLAPSTGQIWTRRQTAPDFKDVKLLNLSGAPALTARAEGQGITFGAMSESREVVALVEYTSGLIWTRKAQINDDLGVFRDGGAQALGAMARYKEDDVRYAILTANAAMSDTGLLFNTTAVTTPGGHANQSAGASTAIYAVAAPGVTPTVVTLFLESEQSPVLKQEVQWDTDDLKVAVRHTVAAKAADWRGMYKDVSGNVTVASLAAIKQAMSLQKDPNGAFINLQPAYILCPVGSKEVAFAQLVGSSVDPAKTNATPNPFFNKLAVVGEPRLN